MINLETFSGHYLTKKKRPLDCVAVFLTECSNYDDFAVKRLHSDK